MKILINGKEQDNIKAIQVDDYWVIVDTKDTYYQKNKFVYSLNGGIGFLDRENEKSYIIKNNTSESCYEFIYTDSWCRIIASTKFIDKSIPVIKFVEQSVKTIEEIFEPFILDNGDTYCHNTPFLIKQLNQAKSSDKKYTEEDVRKAIMLAQETIYVDLKSDEINHRYNPHEVLNIIQSLNQPKLPSVINLEMEEYCQLLKSKNTSLCSRCQFLHPECYKLKTKPIPEGEIIEIKI
jgi:hypothetical protein